MRDMNLCVFLVRVVCNKLYCYYLLLDLCACNDSV